MYRPAIMEESKTCSIGYCTINVDSSFCPRTKVGGYAFWITTDVCTIKGYGRFREICLDPHEAEIKGLINAIQAVKKYSLSPKALVVNCDNKVVRDIVSNNGVNKKYHKVEKILREMLSDFPIFYAKHIRGHSQIVSARNFCNDWCDKMGRNAWKQNHRKIEITWKQQLLP